MGTTAPLPINPQEMEQVRQNIKGQFPSVGEDFVVTSRETSSYNCIAWAAGDSSRWWWPDQTKYWPDLNASSDDVSEFVATFNQFGYVQCFSEDIEQDYEKVAVYEKQGRGTHMARQLPSGRWTSKLGQYYDIEHSTPASLNGVVYGIACHFLKRRLPSHAAK